MKRKKKHAEKRGIHLGAWNIKCLNDEEELGQGRGIIKLQKSDIIIKLTSVVMLTIKWMQGVI